MDIREARERVGNQPHYALINMKKALEMLPWRNSEEDKKNLEAVKMVLKANRKNLSASLNKDVRIGGK